MSVISDEVKKRELAWSNRIVSYRIAWDIKKKGFAVPCLNAYNAREELKTSDGTYYYGNEFMSEASAPTYGLLAWWFKKKHGKFIDAYSHKTDQDILREIKAIVL